MIDRKRWTGWSILLLGEPGQPVKQIRVSKRTVVLAPGALLLVAAVCFAWTAMNSQHQIHELESRLSAVSSQHAVTVAIKNGEVESLKRQLMDATRQTGSLNSRFEDLQRLEDKLRLFVDQHSGENVTPALMTAYTPVSYSPLRASSMTADTPESIRELEELSRLLDGTARTMESNMRKAEQRRAELDSLPSGWPAVSREVTSGFGYRKHPVTGRYAFHAGIDITGDVGDPVFSAGDGTVKETGFERSRGNYIIITHRNGLESLYLHLRKIGVSEGMKIKRGDRIGQVGNTGLSTGPHLHFAVEAGGKPVNPLTYLEQGKED